MGVYRWREIKDTFRGASDPAEQLVPPAFKEAVPVALPKASRQHADRFPMMTRARGIFIFVLRHNPCRRT
eukprot:11179566-Lingulodinium_polyedra.AAC.1